MTSIAYSPIHDRLDARLKSTKGNILLKNNDFSVWSDNTGICRIIIQNYSACNNSIPEKRWINLKGIWAGHNIKTADIIATRQDLLKTLDCKW